MRVYDVFQYAVVATIVPISALYAWRKQAPAGFRRVQVAFAVQLLKPQRAAWLRTVGRQLAPAAAESAACGGCASACSSSHAPS